MICHDKHGRKLSPPNDSTFAILSAEKRNSFNRLTTENRRSPSSSSVAVNFEQTVAQFSRDTGEITVSLGKCRLSRVIVSNFNSRFFPGWRVNIWRQAIRGDIRLLEPQIPAAWKSESRGWPVFPCSTASRRHILASANKRLDRLAFR